MENAPTNENPEVVVTKVEIVANGPVRVHGTLEITHADGSIEVRQRITSFCRCGMSSSKPYCDGTHKRENWQAN